MFFFFVIKDIMTGCEFSIFVNFLSLVGLLAPSLAFSIIRHICRCLWEPRGNPVGVFFLSRLNSSVISQSLQSLHESSQATFDRPVHDVELL